MKKLGIIVTSLVAVFSLVSASAPVYGAVDPNDPLSKVCDSADGAGNSSTCKAEAKNPITGPNGILTKATQLVALAVGVAAVFMIIIGGLRFVTASGDPKNVQGAKDTILFAVIGLVIALAAQAVVLFVLRKL